MYPRHIEHYFAPRNLDEAVHLLAEHQPDVRVLSGGQSLIPLMKDRAVSPRTVIDINRVAGLSDIDYADGALRLGALVRHRDLVANPLVRETCAMLSDAASSIGDPQVRNRGTLGGALAFADVLSDLPVAALALQAQILTAQAGTAGRTLEADAFFAGPRQTALAGDEIVRAIRFSACGPGTGGAFVKQAHVTNGYALISVAVQLRLDQAGTCVHASIVVGGLQTMPARAGAAAAVLNGTLLDDASITKAAREAVAEVGVGDDFRASAEYRSNLIAQYVAGMIRRAHSRAAERT